MADGIEVGSEDGMELGMADGLEVGLDLTSSVGELEGTIDDGAVGGSNLISIALHTLSLVPLHSHKWIP